jgi:hypothetical protein
MIGPQYWLTTTLFVGISYLQSPPVSDAVSLWERGGIVALLLVGIVVLWRNGQQEQKYNRELLVQLLGTVTEIQKVGEKMAEAGDKMEATSHAMTAISDRLEGLHCPLLDKEECREHRKNR